MSFRDYWSKALAIELLPLGVGVPIVIAMATSKPEDVTSNLSAWLEWLGLRNLPDWLYHPSVDSKFAGISLTILAVYAFIVIIMPRLPKDRRMYPNIMICLGVFFLIGGFTWKVVTAKY
jgi:hypothetical protein